MLKRLFFLFLTGVIIFYAVSPIMAESVQEPSVSAQSAILINANTGQVLWAKNENEHLSMASTTKIMTALLTLEAAALNDRCVTVTSEMLRTEGSSMYLKAGDQLTLKSLAAGMLVVSGNDAANSAAIAVGGSLEKFAELMNQRAGELRMKNTHFVTPSGLDDEQHYSTAHDMALLAAAALENQDFAAIVSQKSMNVSFVNPQKTQRLVNHNRLLSMYQDCIGVKTGFTKKSGRCLVSAAERKGVRLVAVTLNAPNDWEDHKKLLDYGFSKLTSFVVDDSTLSLALPVAGGVNSTVTVAGTKADDVVLTRGDEAKVKRIVEAPRFLYAPVRAGQVAGHVRYVLGETVLAETDLVVQQDSPALAVEQSAMQKFCKWFVRFFRLE